MGLMRRHALLTCNEVVLSSTLTVSTFGNINYLIYLCICDRGGISISLESSSDSPLKLLNEKNSVISTLLKLSIIG